MGAPAPAGAGAPAKALMGEGGGGGGGDRKVLRAAGVGEGRGEGVVELADWFCPAGAGGGVGVVTGEVLLAGVGTASSCCRSR